MSEPSSFRIAVVNPLSSEGKEIRARLRERSFPIASMSLLDSGGGTAGTLTEDDGAAAWVSEVGPSSFDDVDAIILCSADETVRLLARKASERGVVVVDLPRLGSKRVASALVAADVNDSSMNLESGAPRMIEIPSPVALLVSRLAVPLDTLAPLARLTLTVIEPASLEGEEALEELLHQSVALLNFSPLPKAVFGRQMAFNVFGSTSNSSAIVSEIRELTGTKAALAMTMLKGPSFHGHGVAILAEWGDHAPALDTVRTALAAISAVTLVDGDAVPGTVEAAGVDALLVGALREEPSIPGAYWFWVAADHLRVGPPLSAVALLERMLGVEPPAASPPRKRRGRS